VDFHASLVTVHDDLAVFQRDVELATNPASPGLAFSTRTRSSFRPGLSSAATWAFRGWRQLSFPGSVVSRTWALMANFIASSAEAHTSACFTFASSGRVNV
jgi:hypothetical protein